MPPSNEHVQDLDHETALGTSATRAADARASVKPSSFPRGVRDVIYWARVTALGLAHTHGAVLKDLSYYANEEGWAWVSQDVLAAVCGKSRSVVCETLLDLERLGILTSRTRNDREGYNKEYRLDGHGSGWQPDWPHPDDFGKSIIEQITARMDAANQEKDAANQENARLRRMLEAAGIDPNLVDAPGDGEEPSIGIHDVPEGIIIRNNLVNEQTGEILLYGPGGPPEPSVVIPDTRDEPPAECSHSGAKVGRTGLCWACWNDTTEGREASADLEAKLEESRRRREVEDAVEKYWTEMARSPENPKGWDGKRKAAAFYVKDPDKFAEDLEVFIARRKTREDEEAAGFSGEQGRSGEGTPARAGRGGGGCQAGARRAVPLRAGGSGPVGLG